MKLYVVVSNSYNDMLGTEINLFGIYETEEQAIERVKYLRKNNKKKICISRMKTAGVLERLF